MMQDRLRGQVELIREVFNYTAKYRDSLFVIKISDDDMIESNLSVLVNDLAMLHQNGLKIIIVPGARSNIDRITSRYNITPKQSSGLRITTPDALPFVKMAAFDNCSKVMTLLTRSRVNGVIGNWVRARSLGVLSGVDYEQTGEVDKISVDVISGLLDEEMIPIVPTIGWSRAGDAYNLSSDELAMRLAIDMGAKKLFFISSDEVLKKNDFVLPQSLIETGGDRIARMSLLLAEEFLELNRDNDFHAETPICLSRIEKAIIACNGGVDRVHLINGTISGCLLKEIYSNDGVGTMIFKDEFEQIRPLKRGDIDSVLSLIRPYIERKVLIERDRSDLEKTMDDYVVYAMDNTIHGCAALNDFGDGVGEISSLAVLEEESHPGTGSKMVRFLIDKAKVEGYKKIFVLTTRATDWFIDLGFEPGDVDDLPEKKKSKYDKSRNSKILFLSLK